MFIIDASRIGLDGESMARSLRIEKADGVYHVINRGNYRQDLFINEGAHLAFESCLFEACVKCGWVLEGYCVMTNHFHLAVRTGAVPLSRSMRQIGGRFSQRYNLIHRRYGPLWQGRYKSRNVDDSEYLHQLILYIHLNPVRAGVAPDPGAYGLSGHRELMKRTANPIVDVDDTLAVFGDTLRAARRSYLRALESVAETTWSKEGFKSLPWWRRSDRVVEPTDVEYVDVLGRSTGLERPKLEAEDFVRHVCLLLEEDIDRLAGRARDSSTAASRRLLATLGIERWGQRAKDLARVLNKNPDVVSAWASKCGSLRQVDPGFSEEVEILDRELSRTFT